MLCDTCRDYPRHMEEFEGLREGSLSLSCIEAAKLILGCKEPVQFLHFEDDVEDEERHLGDKRPSLAHQIGREREDGGGTAQQ